MKIIKLISLRHILKSENKEQDLINLDIKIKEMQLKSVTLCSSRHGMPLRSFKLGLRPLVKVNVEAVSNSGQSVM